MCFGPLRFVPGGLVPFREVFPCRSGPLRADLCYAEHKIGIFVRFLASGPPIFRPFEHKIGILVSEWAIFPRFLVVLTQKWGFCAREA